MFCFFKILIFQVVNGVKGQKMVHNDKKLCPSRSISQEPYIMWFSFMVQMYKMIISPGVFFHFFKILNFLVVKLVKVQIIIQNDKKIFFFNWDLLYARLNSHCKVWRYKKKKHKKIILRHNTGNLFSKNLQLKDVCWF